MGFMKLDESILYSTIWDASWEELKVFLSCCLIARPFKLDKEVPQLDPITDEPTGWSVPPGDYGFARGASIGIARTANLGSGTDRIQVGLQALRRLGEPETGSKTQAYGGRRVVRVDGGFLILNLMKFRDCTAAERQRQFRSRSRANTSDTPADTGDHPDDTGRRTADADRTLSGQKRHPMEVARERKAAKETDPRFAPLRAIWEQEWVSAIGTQYRWLGARDAKALHSLLAIPETEFRDRAKKGITATGYARCSSVSQLAAKWNDLAMPNGETKKLAFAPACPDEAFTGGERPI